MKKLCHHLVLKLLFALMLMFSFATIGFGQTIIVPAKVPEQEMEQVVRRILIWSFKPRNQPTEIYLSEKGIKQTWLPKIKNIEFRLLSDKEFEQRNEGAYLFTDAYFSEDKYQIGFLFGKKCEADGKGWYFRLTDQKVKLWQSGEYGVRCDSVMIRTID